MKEEEGWENCDWLLKEDRVFCSCKVERVGWEDVCAGAGREVAKGLFEPVGAGAWAWTAVWALVAQGLLVFAGTMGSACCCCCCCWGCWA